MSKSIKLKNDIYIDSSGVVHNQELLGNILENMKAVTLYDNSDGTTNTTVELTEDISMYRYIEAWVGLYSKYVLECWLLMVVVQVVLLIRLGVILFILESVDYL